MAAPVGGQILADVLPYLELENDQEEEKEMILEVTVPEVRGKSLKETRQMLKELGLEVQTNLSIDPHTKEEEIRIKEQLPKPGIKVKQGSKITVEI